MNLLVFRHAAAAPLLSSGGKDSDRPLTTQGREAFAAGARAWRRFAPPPDLIWSSPYLRTRQTSQLLVDAFGDVPVQTDPLLVPDSDPGEVIHSLPDGDTIYVVTHMPLVGELLSQLATGSAHGMLALASGQGVLLEMIGRSGGRMIASLTTEAAAALG